MTDYPDKTARLRYIFADQVYGLTPTEIVYRITMQFLQGIKMGFWIGRHHLRQVDAVFG